MRSIFRTTGVSALAFAAVAAQAATIVQDISVGPKTTDFNETATYNLFDSSLGTLTEISYEFEIGVMGSIALENLGPNPDTGEATLKARIQLVQPPFGPTYADETFEVTKSASLSGFDGSLDFAGGSGATFLNLKASNSYSGTVNDAATLALFSTGGTGSVNVIGTGLSSGSGTGNFAYSIDTQGFASGKLTYTYTPVPEPASLAILGMGALGLIRRRRKG